MRIARVKSQAAEDVGVEAQLSFLLLSSLLPEGGAELEDAGGGPGGQQAQQVAQVAPGLDAVQVAGGEQRDEGGVDAARLVVAQEEPVLAADDLAAQRLLADVVVCVLKSRVRLAGGSPARSTDAPTGSTRGGSGGDK